MRSLFVVFTLVLVLTGCSLLPDRYRDRAGDYLNTQEQPATQSLPNQPLVYSDRYLIPKLDSTPSQPTEFKVPMPSPLVVEVAAEGSASLNELRNETPDPRIEHDGAGGLILRINGGFAQSWSLVSDAIAASELKLSDLNRSTGTWYLTMDKAVKAEDRGWWSRLWNNDEVVEHSYLLKMSRTRSGVYLSLLEDDDALADETVARNVFEQIKAQIDTQRK